MTTATQKYIKEWRNQWGTSETYGRPIPQPRVVTWARANHQGKPYFIKVLPKTSSNENGRGTGLMFVPGEFVKEHYQELQRKVTLENSDGRRWRVKFQRPVVYPVWSQGWPRFAHDNDLKTGDHIVFILKRDSFFHFRHFDKEGNITGRHVNTPPINNPDASASHSDEFQSISLGKKRRNYPDRHVKKEPASLEIDITELSDGNSEGGDVLHSQGKRSADSFHSEPPGLTEMRSSCVKKVTHEDNHKAGMSRQAPKQVLKTPTAVGAVDSCRRVPVERQGLAVAEDDWDSDHSMPSAQMLLPPQGGGRMPVKLTKVKREALAVVEDDWDLDDSMPLAQRGCVRNPSTFSLDQRLKWARRFYAK